MSEIKRIRLLCSALDSLSEFGLADGRIKTAMDLMVTEDGQLRSFERSQPWKVDLRPGP